MRNRWTGWKNYGGIFDIDARKNRLEKLQAQSALSDFWNNQEEAQAVLKEINNLKDWTDAWDSLHEKIEESLLMFGMVEEEEDEAALADLSRDADQIEKDLDNLELRRMLGGEDDSSDAIVTIHPGAGGTESQDWAEMLFRMYTRFFQQKGFSFDVLDLQSGEEAGLKSVTLEVSGEYAYGYLKAEAGVHRLVRISPFDSNKRRHTSFASVFVYPEVEENIEVNINPSDLRIDTYRASGAGGQHVNKTSSAVRITHIPTGLVVQCQSERSQHQNKANAMKILLSRLYQKKKEEESKRLEAIEKNKKEIAWGSQIRSYVFQPYTLVKDHRTNVETSDIQKVMDGFLDPFVKGYLLEYS